jgi:hypothetical protein
MKHQFKYENPILLLTKLTILVAITGLAISAMTYWGLLASINI